MTGCRAGNEEKLSIIELGCQIKYVLNFPPCRPTITMWSARAAGGACRLPPACSAATPAVAGFTLRNSSWLVVQIQIFAQRATVPRAFSRPQMDTVAAV